MPFDWLAIGLFLATFLPSLCVFVALVEQVLARDLAAGPLRQHG